MEKEIKLYTYVDGINDTPFPNEREQIVIANFKYDANRMGDAPSIEATAMHRLCLDNLWTDNVYAEFNGEKYFIMNTPSSNKSNEDERYEHELILKSEREVLNHVYFIDAVQGDSGQDQVKSNSTKVQFMGDIKQFVERLNASLSYTKMEYTAVIDEDITSEDKMVEFEDQYVLQALQEIYNVYELPYYFDGKTIHVGYEKNAITTPFKYGYDEALLSVSKENANYKVVNRCSGYGSEENIPYYYPNNSPKGDASVKVVSGNISAGKFVIYDYEKFVANMSPTDTCSVRKEQDGDIYKFVWSVGGKDIELSDIGIRLASGVIPIGNESFTQTLEAQIPYSQYLMPPVYRETKGKERFYNAKNDTYPVPDGEGYYIFENEYSEKNPDEMIVEFSDIKPTIKGITNSQGQRIDMFLDFAYDQNDNDEVDSEGNYVHPYFFAKLRKTNGDFGFNLFDHASEDQTMQISFTSGVCGSCTFEIGVGEETNQNIVQVDDSGNLKRDENGNVLWGNQSPQPRQNDTGNYEVWIALKKDDTTYTNIMPNVSMDLKPSTSDKFVILGINLPQAYITAAEEKLKDSIIKYMFMNNSEKFNFSIKFSRIYFTEHPEVLEKLNENARLLVEYNGEEYTFYVDNFTYSMDESSSLPEIEVNLVDTLTIGKNSLETAISGIKQDILSTLGGGDILKQGLKYFLRKDTDDVAKGKITFRKGIDVGSFSSLVSGGTFRIDADGKSYIEVDKLLVRMKAIFEELQIKKVSYIGGEQYVTPASMEVKRVEEGDTYYRCYATEDDSTPYEMEFAVGDQALSKMADLSSGTDVSNRYYWRLVSNVGKNYIDLSKNDADSLSDIPQVGDIIVSLGNRSEKDRQNAIIISSVSLDAPSIKMLQGIDSFSLEGKDMISQGFDTSTNRAFLKIFGDLFAGDPDNTTYIKYDSVGKELEVKGKFITRGGTDIDTALSNIQDQIDGNIETWFYDPEPTLENEPAVNWTTPTEKDKHLGDLYYSGEGKAYRFQKDGNSYIWKLIQDTDITKALEEAKKAQEAASSAQNTANEAKESVSDLNTYVDGAFKDGVVTEAEAIAIEKYQNSVNETKKSVQGTYNTLYSNVYLEGSAKTELKSAYDSLISSIDTLLSKISSAIADGKASVQEKNEVDIAYAAFNDKMEAYDTAVEKANKAIQDKLKSYSDEAMDAIAGYEYLKEAFKNDTTIEGGVVSTSIVYTGYRNTQGKFVPMSGINGIYLEDASKSHGISYWAGGNLIDRETYSNPEDIPVDAATAVIRMDGSGYFANGNLTWTKEGILHADPLSFFVGEEMVGDILKLFSPIYDESDGTTVIGIQAKYPMMVAGGVTMYSGSPLTPSDIFKGLVLDPNTLKWNEKGQLTVIGGTGSDFNESLMWTLLSNATTEQINISHLTDALTGYATESWVSGKNYAVKATTLAGYGITDGINAVSVTGTGNAVTAASISGHILTLTKGSTFSLSGHKHAWTDITSGKPSTLSGYGITDAYTKTDADSRYVNVSGDTMTGVLTLGASSGIKGTSSSNMQIGLYTPQNIYLQTPGILYYSPKPGTNHKIWHAENDGHGSGLDADLLDGIHANGLLTALSTSSATNLSITVGGTTKSITDLFANSAAKLETARTLWGQSFDGTKNVSGDLISVGNITGSGTFSSANTKVSDSVYINGIRLHKTADGVITLEGNLAVTGGVTMYAIDPVSASTVMDGVAVDGTTIAKVDGVLKVLNAGGGEAGSVAWGNVTGKPSVFSTNIANITDLHSSWDAVLKAQKPAWLTAVSIATISDLHANWDALLKAAPSAYVTRWPTFAEVTSKPSTLSGYGITDAYTKTDSDSRYINTSGDTMTGNLYFNSSDYPFFNKSNSYAFYNISVNLESWSNNYFYPVKVTSNTPSFPLCTVSISSTSGSASLPLNNNSIRFMVRTGGWSDIGKRLIVLDHWTYSSSEITIYAIYLGEENGDCVVYLRGGVNYIISISGKDWISSSDSMLTNGNERYPKIDLSGNPTDGRSFARCYRAWSHSNGYGLGLHAENSDKLGGVSSEYFMRTKSQEGYYGMALPDGSDNNWIRTTSFGIIPYSSTVKSSLGTGQWKFGEANIETIISTTTKASNWFRSTGDTGWVNETYGGGWYMTDGTWIRAYANKSITGYNIQGSGKVSANSGMYVYGMYGSSWANGDGAYSVAVPSNANQTTLLLAYNGVNNNVTGSDRYFSIEVLNENNRNVRMIVQSSHLMELTKSTVTIFGDLSVTGGGTFYSSDIRYKSIIQQTKLSLSDIAKAPSFVYHWNKEGMNCNRLNLGGSAQYTQSILPWAVEDNNGFLSMDYATVAYTFAVHTARHLLTYETRTDKKIKKLEREIVILKKQLKKLGYEEVRTLDDQSV